mgnify:CR=1 FL=1
MTKKFKVPTIPTPKKYGPEYYETYCLTCGKMQYAPTEYVICATCMETDLPSTTIVNLTRRIAELEKSMSNISLAANAEVVSINDGDYEIGNVLQALTNIERDADDQLSKAGQ